MRIAEPVFPLQMESAISLEEALSMAQSDESALEAYRFCTGSAAGWVLEKGEYKACSFSGCRLTGAHLSKSWLRDVVFERCELSGLRLMESTLQRVRFVNCKFSGANLAGASLQDVLFQNCTADGLMLPESRLKNVVFEDCNLQEASFSTLGKKSSFCFERCDLRAVDFFRTSLNGIDLTSCEIDGIRLEGPEVRGAIVTALQACDLAKLLGVVIKS